MLTGEIKAIMAAIILGGSFAATTRTTEEIEREVDLAIELANRLYEHICGGKKINAEEDIDHLLFKEGMQKPNA